MQEIVKKILKNKICFIVQKLICRYIFQRCDEDDDDTLLCFLLRLSRLFWNFFCSNNSQGREEWLWSSPFDVNAKQGNSLGRSLTLGYRLPLFATAYQTLKTVSSKRLKQSFFSFPNNQSIRQTNRLHVYSSQDIVNSPHCYRMTANKSQFNLIGRNNDLIEKGTL